MTDYFCGIGNIPKGKKIGTAKQCLSSKQVRYWGVESVPARLIKQRKQAKKLSLTQERLILKKLEDQAKKLVRDVKNVKGEIAIREEKGARPLKTLDTKLADLLKRKNPLIKKIKKQMIIVDKKEAKKLK